MFVRFWNHLSCHDVLEKMTSECNLEIPTDRKFSGSAVNILHALPNIFGCHKRRVKKGKCFTDEFPIGKFNIIRKLSQDRGFKNILLPVFGRNSLVSKISCCLYLVETV